MWDNIKNVKEAWYGAGEVSQWLKALSSIPCTHMPIPTTSDSSFRGSDPLASVNTRNTDASTSPKRELKTTKQRSSGSAHL